MDTRTVKTTEPEPHVFPLHVHQAHLLLEFRQAVVAVQQFVQGNVATVVLSSSLPMAATCWAMKHVAILGFMANK